MSRTNEGPRGNKPLLLDLFCGAGGCSVGYARAGFHVVGVDIVEQPNYPGVFIKADAMTFPLDGYDVIHASPPCKRWSVANRVAASRQMFDPHPDLLTPTRERLEATGRPYVIENVPGSPMSDYIVLCGSMFGLRVRRHRWFETRPDVAAPECRHEEQGPVVGVYGNGGAWTRTAPGGGGVKVVGKEAADALGVTWTTKQTELSQMIPPAYTEYLGRRIIEAIEHAA